MENQGEKTIIVIIMAKYYNPNSRQSANGVYKSLSIDDISFENTFNIFPEELLSKNYNFAYRTDLKIPLNMLVFELNNNKFIKFYAIQPIINFITINMINIRNALDGVNFILYWPNVKNIKNLIISHIIIKIITKIDKYFDLLYFKYFI